ncbi:hypothetical protein CEUSTIGMA_g2060.t1 [Chlamydomonas eustigma]|uniref:Partial AB-hydrolase lipase domain-containing protein n=1 Tax=Chlamydomonas eustigma TaxID=1157962 RepID=A0A250WVG8_9CHLO|nr:hypothetical protein CEUSTIGMA_g2060.t1 [Chlamydomonas eustigma]|eukprot:GAX74612.1 hypothetical protein CEUSTIGMA_g2060.t1 [Chlamydomonas eustigma]
MAGWASLLLLITRFLSWIHACVVAPLVHWWEESVLGIWEHVVTSVLRESFNEWTRIANGMSAWFLSLFQYNYRDKLRKAWKPGPSKAAEPSRPSTLNAILEALHRAESRPSSENEAVIPPPTCEGVRMDEIQSPCDTTGEALPFLSMQSSRFELKSSPGRLSTLMRRRPWPTHSTKQPSAPTHHSPPTKPSSGSHRLFSTPEEGAGLSEVAAAFMQPSGAGVIVRQRGLLEDARIWTELAVAQGFSAWRQSVRWIFRVPSHERALTPSPASTPRDLDLTTCDSLPTQPQATKDHIGCWDVTSNMDCAEDGRTKFNAAAASLFEAAAQCPSMRQSISTCASASASAASCSSDHPQDYEVGRVYGGDKVSLEDTEQQHPLIHSTVVPQLPQRPSLWSWLRHRGRPPQCHSNSLPPSQPRQEAGIVLEGRMGRCEGRMGRCEGRMGRCQRLLPRSQSMRDTRNKQPPLQVNVHSPTASSDTNSPSTPIVAPPAISPASPAVAQNSSSRPCYLPASSPPLRRVRSFSRSEGSVLCQHMSEVSNAADVVRLSGYPLEQHTVTTQDGYILVLDRIPRHNSKEVVFFMHGVMDSSMTWVSGGEVLGKMWWVHTH